MNSQLEYTREVTPYSLIIINGAVERYALDTEVKLSRARKAGAIVLEDWKTAEKVAFGLSDKDGETLSRPRGFPAPLFKPTNLPIWATELEE